MYEDVGCETAASRSGLDCEEEELDERPKNREIVSAIAVARKCWNGVTEIETGDGAEIAAEWRRGSGGVGVVGGDGDYRCYRRCRKEERRARMTKEGKEEDARPTGTQEKRWTASISLSCGRGAWRDGGPG